MASDVGKFLSETLLTCLEEIGPKLPHSLCKDFHQIKKCIVDEESQINIWSSSFPSASESLLQHLYDLNYALDDCRVFAENLSRLNPFQQTYFVRKMKQRLEPMKNGLTRLMHTLPISTTTFPTGRHTWFESNASQVLDFGEKEKEIEELLLDEGYKAIGVYGTSGSGKTALIQKALNNPTVCKQFSPIIWVECSSLDLESEEDEDEDVGGKILKYILSELGNDVDEWAIVNPSNTLLLENLKKLLMSKRYLIVFDDMWQKNDFYSNLGGKSAGADSDTVMNRLSDALPRDGGGKIIITSKLKEVAKKMVGVNLIHLKPVNKRLEPIIGFGEQEKELEALLLDEKYKAIGIYGMSGSGKTALIQKVLSSPSVYNDFSPIIWVCLSDIDTNDDEDFGVKIVKCLLCDLGNDVDRWIHPDPRNTELLRILKNSLMSKKYLIVLDDVWEKNDFYANLGDTSVVADSDTVGDRLLDALPGDRGGKIIVTSRLREVAENMVGQKNLIHMKPLNSESCRFILEAGMGFPQYATKIESLLDDSGFVAIGIYGPSKSANTALIHNVLSSGSVRGPLEPILWVSESHISSVEEMTIGSQILKYMLKELKYDVDESMRAHSEFELLEIVNRSLLSKKYLIVMADLVDYGAAWIWLFNALRHQKGDGTVIVTSGIKEVAQKMVGENNLIHVRLPELGTNETSEVTIHSQYVTDEIVQLCHGLPLAAKTLANMIRDDKGPRVLKDLSELEEKILEYPAMKILKVSYDKLDRLQLRLCLLFLSVFPEDEVIKKSSLIYWWLGEGLIKTEENGEEIFEELLKVDIIKPYGNGKCPVVNKCKIHPWIRYMLISLARNAMLFDFDSKGIPLFDINNSRRACLVFDAGISSHENTSNNNYVNLRTIFNVNEKYLDFDSEWVASLKRLVVLQLGRWQDLPDHHIEVNSEAFLEVLRTQKHLKYLSFRGISRITILPPSIIELVSLEILDLKACHNLERLPADIGSLKKLTHLDVSECYLLESMPKGLEKLTSLQVLKGFIIGNSKKTPCRVGDLKSLEKLKRLSIHIGSEAVIQDGEFDKLKDLKLVGRLKISWGVVSQKLKEQVVKQSFSFPPSLEKLVLEGLPQEGVPEWLKPSKLQALKKLYIKGGKLNRLDISEDGRRMKVEILRLKYLNLKIGLPKLQEMFPKLRYVEKIGREKTKEVHAPHIYEEGTEDFEWSIEAPEASMSRP